MSIIDSITGIFSSKEEPKKAPARKVASRKAKPGGSGTVVKKPGATAAMAAHSKDRGASGKSGKPKTAAKKKAAH
jgi:hypothetical protein